MALDKTGTLTLGEPRVTELVPLGGRSAGQVLAVAAAVEARSQHPLALAVLSRAHEQEVDVPAADDFRSLTGAGARARIGGAEHYVGSPRLFKELGVDLAEVRALVENLEEMGQTVVAVGTAEEVHGLLAIADPLRPEAAGALAELKGAGIEHVVMLTGDNPRAARAIAARVGVDEVHAELDPEGKTRKVEELDGRFGRVAMVGDGVNDAPALAAAHVGIAMGAAGTDVALETADVALMADDLSRLPYLVRFSRRTWAVIQQNLVLSALVVGALVLGAVTGSLSLPAAVLAHEVSEFVVIASGLRMLRA
jgi:Cd2+/Zn2+-exporting ATPase